MKIISSFVDRRDGRRYGPGEYDKISRPLEPDDIERLKKAGCLAEGDDAAEDRKGPHGIPRERVEMRTEAGEAAQRDADARAVARTQRPTEAEQRSKQSVPTGGSPDGIAGRAKPVAIEPTK